MSYPRVSIIILNWNGLKDTIECLKSLKKITYPNYEVILVDNGSEGNDADILEERHKGYIELIRNKKNLGFAGGNNVGIRQTIKKGESEYILLLNNDTVVDPNFLDKLVEVAESDSQIGILGPKIYYYNQLNKFYSTGFRIYDHLLRGLIFSSRGRGELDQGQYNKATEVDFITGCCLLVHKKVIKEIGLMNEDYFLYFEDADWSLRAKQLDFKIVYIPHAIIWHKGQASTKNETSLQIYYRIRNKLLFCKKHFKNKIRFWCYFYPAYFLYSLILVCKFLLKNKGRQKIKTVFKAHLDFIERNLWELLKKSNKVKL